MTKPRSKWNGNSFLTWTDVEKDVKILAKRIKKSGFMVKEIATVSRGGLIPARLMADHLNVKRILVDKKISDKTLFVDDIYDSGKTFKKTLLQVKLPQNFVYVTLVARKGVKYPKQLIFARKTKGKEYIVFPWEIEEHREYKLKSRIKRSSKPKNK